ncbi:MAG TPA: alpha/beta fold hydrolase [Bacillota bacterium]|nr:alpha/beta fold hydrolase [Bacillota bacterium]
MFRKSNYHRTMLGGIELHIFEPPEIADPPLVFVLHPFTVRASWMFGFCRDLAKKGFRAVTFDLRNHGGRMVNAKRNGRWRKGEEDRFFSLMVDMYSYLVGTAQDISLLLDLMPARFGYPIERVGVIGFSLGGHATLITMANEPRIKVGAAIIGGGDFKTLMKDRWERYGYPADHFDQRWAENLAPIMEKYDPIRRPEVFADRPLLMTNGAKDILVPLVCNENFYQKIEPYYSAKDRVRLEVYPEFGHRVHPPMWNEAQHWLVKWL